MHGVAARPRRLGVLIQRFELWPARLHFVFTLALLLAISVIDAGAPKEISFSVFYFVPVVWAAWFAGRGAGITVAVLASLAWGAMDMLAGLSASAPAVAIWNELVRLGLFLLVWAMLTEAHSVSADRQRLALTDPLTGVANIRVLTADIDREIERIGRFSRPFALAYLDLDRFKEINDSLGHHTGDNILCSVAAILSGQARATDTVARLGGDEFAILMPETDEAAARAALERMSAGLAEVVRAAAPRVEGAGASVGIAVFTAAPRSVDQALSLADGLMYEAKRASGNSIVLRAYAEEPGDV
jgi:diguanylate cyclase (GGDEF)-like protein